jgi:transposase
VIREIGDITVAAQPLASILIFVVRLLRLEADALVKLSIDHQRSHRLCSFVAFAAAGFWHDADVEVLEVSEKFRKIEHSPFARVRKLVEVQGYMGVAYSMDLRRRVWAAYEKKEGTEVEVAQRFGVSPSFVRDLVRLQRETGSIAPRPHGGGRRPVADEEGLRAVAAAVAEHPGATYAELMQELARRRVGRRSYRFSNGSLGRTLQRLQLTRKKRPPRQ